MRRPLQTVIAAILLCLFVVVFLERERAHAVWQHLTDTNRPPISLSLQEVSQDWDERTLRSTFPALRIDCYSGWAPNLGDRSCFADIASFNGVSAMVIAFHLENGKVNHVSVHTPSWKFEETRAEMLRAHGEPTAQQSVPAAGYRLAGWRLDNGASVFLNRDRPMNPFAINQVMWSSRRACLAKPCWQGFAR